MLWVRMVALVVLLGLQDSSESVRATQLVDEKSRSGYRAQSGCFVDSLLIGANWSVSVRILSVSQAEGACHDVVTRPGLCLEFSDIRLCLFPGEAFLILRGQ